MTEAVRQHELRNGQMLTIQVAEPPFPKFEDKVACWWSNVADSLLAGEFREALKTPYYIGEIDGDVAGYMVLMVPADSPEIGLVEFVITVEEQRRKGVSSALMGALVADFVSSGGLALYLCTTNPHAGQLYERHGFRYHIGDGMRCLAPSASDFDDSFFARGGEGCVRSAHWGDVPKAAALFNHRSPNWMIKDDLTDCFRDTRFESHCINLLKRIEGDRGVCCVLENEARRVVGLAAAERRNNVHEQHVARMSFRIAPAYTDQTGDLLSAVQEGAAEIGISCLETRAAACDLDYQSLVETAGFDYQAMLPDRFQVDGRSEDIVLYSRFLDNAAPVPRTVADYYGGRKEWQSDRVCGQVKPESTADRGRLLFEKYSFGENERSKLNADGHLILPGLLTTDSRELLTNALVHIESKNPWGGTTGHEVGRFAAEYSRYLESLIGHPQMRELARRVLGEDIRFDHCVALNRAGGNSGSTWHSHEYSDDDISLGFVRIFFYINGFEAGEANLKVVPGSHHCRDPKVRAESDDELRSKWIKDRLHPHTQQPLEIEQLSTPPGSVVLMWTHAVHGVNPRKEESDTRWMVVFAYRNPGCPSVARWITPAFERKRINGAEGLMSLY